MPKCQFDNGDLDGPEDLCGKEAPWILMMLQTAPFEEVKQNETYCLEHIEYAMEMTDRDPSTKCIIVHNYIKE